MLSEKDLWCKDLDDFVIEWNTQLKEEEDYQKTIRNTNRRASRKIGAGGKNASNRSRNTKADDAYNPIARKTNSTKPIVQAQPKTQQKFIDSFTKPKKDTKDQNPKIPKSVDSDDEFDVDAMLPTSNSASQTASREPRKDAGLQNTRTKRAVPAKSYDLGMSAESESESFDSPDDIGDVGNMVKGIGGGDKTEPPSSNGRMSLFTSRQSIGHGSGSFLPKLKSKPSRGFEEDNGADDTNYEMLARSSPQKPAATKENLDSFLSDDDLMPVPKKIPTNTVAKTAAKAAPKTKKPGSITKNGDSGKMNKASTSAENVTKTGKLQPKSNDIFSDDDEIEMNDSPPPKPISRKKSGSTGNENDDDESIIDRRATGRSRPTRAAAANPRKPIYIDSEDEETDEGQDSLNESDESD